MLTEEHLKKVELYAAQRHAGRFRNGSEPYIAYPIAVANLVSKYTENDIELVAAALLHDVVDSCKINIEQLAADLIDLFGIDNLQSINKIINYVDDLSYKFTKEKYPKVNRAKRRELQIKAFQSLKEDGLKIIKLADIINNLLSIDKLDDGYRDLYLIESYKIINSLYLDNKIYQYACDILIGEITKSLKNKKPNVGTEISSISAQSITESQGKYISDSKTEEVIGELISDEKNVSKQTFEIIEDI